MNNIPFPVYDADNHFYEPEDAFLRHLPKQFSEDFYYIERNGRKRLVINGVISQYIPNPTFAVVAKAGAHEMWMRAENPQGLSLREMTGKPIAPPQSWRTGAERTALLDQQGLHACLIFPTLASIIEANLEDKPDAIAALFTSLNTWMHEEWGYARADRLFGVPFINLCNVDQAVQELERVIKLGARAVAIRPAPVPGIHGSRSFGFPEFDPFWARVADAGIFVCLHSSVTKYSEMIRWWTGGTGGHQPFVRDSFKASVDYLSRNIADAVAALICHGVFDRHPQLRVASIENGADFVEPLLHRLERAYKQLPQEFKENPRDTFARHLYVAPFYEDNVDELRHIIPVERILFGSDFPHAEGTPEPLDYLREFKNYKADEIEKVFSTNLKNLLEGRAA